MVPGFFPGKFHEQRNLVGYSPWGRRVRHDWVTNIFTFSKILHRLSLSILRRILWGGVLDDKFTGWSKFFSASSSLFSFPFSIITLSTFPKKEVIIPSNNLTKPSFSLLSRQPDRQCSSGLLKMSLLPLLLALVGGLLLLHVVLVFVCFIFSCIRAWHLESERLGFTPGSAISQLDKLLQFFDPSFLLQNVSMIFYLAKLRSSYGKCKAPSRCFMHGKYSLTVLSCC